MRIILSSRHILQCSSRNQCTPYLLGAATNTLGAIVSKLSAMFIELDAVAHNRTGGRRRYYIREKTIFVHGFLLLDCSTIGHIHRLAKGPFAVVIIRR